MTLNLVFDSMIGGHHRVYINHLLEHWCRTGRSDRLVLATAEPIVSELAIRLGGDLAGLSRTGDVSLVRLPKASRGGHLGELLHEQTLIPRVLRQVRPDQLLLMYLDPYQALLAAGLGRKTQVRIGGLLFRPMSHHATLGGSPNTQLERIRAARKTVLIRAALHNPRLDTIFSLDPYAVPVLEGLGRGVRVLQAPDPVDAPPQLTAAERAPRHGRLVAVLFGSMSRRKGLLQLLEATALLPEATLAGLSFVIAGPVDNDIRDETQRHITELQGLPGAELAWRDGSLSDEDGARLIAQADVCLLPYQRHVGSSNVLLKAAGAAVPVIGPDYGLVGRYIREYHLGVSVDTRSPRAIADALISYVAKRSVDGFDPFTARTLASQHTIERFSDTLTEGWLDRAS